MVDVHGLLSLAFSEARGALPSDREVARVLAAVPSRRPRRGRRALVFAFAMLALSAGVALGIPQTRSALFESFGRLGDFLTGGELPLDGAAGVSTRLNYLDLAQSETPRTLVEHEGERLIAFLKKGTRQPCLGLGRHVVECGDPAFWQMRFPNPTVGILTTTRTNEPGAAALWGVAADAVTSVQVRYGDGSAERGVVGRNGFVVIVDATRVPVTLVAEGKQVGVLVQMNVSGLQWQF